MIRMISFSLSPLADLDALLFYSPLPSLSLLVPHTAPSAPSRAQQPTKTTAASTTPTRNSRAAVPRRPRASPPPPRPPRWRSSRRTTRRRCRARRPTRRPSSRSRGTSPASTRCSPGTRSPSAGSWPPRAPTRSACRSTSCSRRGPSPARRAGTAKEIFGDCCLGAAGGGCAPASRRGHDGNKLGLPGWHVTWACSTKKLGYSGVAIASRVEPLSVRVGIGNGDVAAGDGAVSSSAPSSPHPHDVEGRFVAVEFERFWLATAYVPNSSEGLRRLKYRVGEDFSPARATAASGLPPGTPCW